MKPETRDASVVTVLEKRPRWAPELQRRFLGESVDVRACRAIGDIAGRDSVSRVNPAEAAGDGRTVGSRVPPSAPCPRDILVIDLEADLPGCLQYLGRRFETAPPVVAIGTGAGAALEWTVRELGAVAFLANDPTGSDLVRICRKIWNNPRASDEFR